MDVAGGKAGPVSWFAAHGGRAVAIVEEPHLAAAEVGGIGTCSVFSLVAQGVESGGELGFGGVAKVSGLIVGLPAGGAWGSRYRGGGCVGSAQAKDVPEAEEEDQADEDVVAGVEAHGCFRAVLEV